MEQQTGSSSAGGRGKPVRVGVIGVGEFGASLAIRDRHTQAVSVCAFADLDVEQAQARLVRAGLSRDSIEVCDSRSQAVAALERGGRVLTADASLLPGLPIDILVDSTGHPEAAARMAEASIANGLHVAMASKECDSVIGPLLYRKARAAGVVYTPVDGDQPSLLMKLVDWSRRLGLKIVAAGKASEYDFVYDPQTRSVASHGRQTHVPALEECWQLPARAYAEAIEARASMLAEMPRTSAPDYCEMGIVANATGLRLDQPRLHAPIARTLELPDLFCMTRDGGLFESEGTVDTFNCLRRADELSFAGGVFVVCDIGDDDTFAVLRGKGIPASRDGSRLLLYNPTHLLGVEALASILDAALRGQSSVDDAYRPRYDLVGSSTRDLPAGTLLEIGDRHTHTIADVEPLLLPAAPIAAATSLPYYMALGNTLARPVKAGQLLTMNDFVAPTDAALWRLRAEQDRTFT